MINILEKYGCDKEIYDTHGNIPKLNNEYEILDMLKIFKDFYLS